MACGHFQRSSGGVKRNPGFLVATLPGRNRGQLPIFQRLTSKTGPELRIKTALGRISEELPDLKKKFELHLKIDGNFSYKISSDEHWTLEYRPGSEPTVLG